MYVTLTAHLAALILLHHMSEWETYGMLCKMAAVKGFYFPLNSQVCIFLSHTSNAQA